MKKNEPLGALAVRLGFATPEQVSETIREQRRREARGEKHFKLGRLMTKRGVLSREQLISILRHYGSEDFQLSDHAIQLAARVRSSLDDLHRAILFTGMRTGDGVTTIGLQIAHALAMTGEVDVLFVDANLRASSLTLQTYIHNDLEPAGKPVGQVPGLSEYLAGDRPLEEVLLRTGTEGFSLLPAGNIAVDFQSLLLSGRFKDLIDRLRKEYLVIIDSAPLLSFPDVALIASHTDGAVIVSAAGKTRRGDLLETKALLDGLNVRTLGTILNEGRLQAA